MAVLKEGTTKEFHQTGSSDALIKFPQKFKTKKRTLAERERDLADIARYYLGGMTHQEITDKLNSEREYTLSRRMVSKDVGVIWVRWRESYIMDANELRVRELTKLDKLEITYWEAWDRSVKDIVTVKQDKTADKVAHGLNAKGETSDTDQELRPSYERTKTTTEKKQSVGDVKFLEGIERVIEKRCKILGLFAAKNVNINWRKQAEKDGLDPDKVVDELTEYIIEQNTSDASWGSVDGRGNGGGVGEGAET